MIDLDVCIEKIKRGQILDEYEVKFICEKVTELFVAEANIQELSSPITIVGDIHGFFISSLIKKTI
jgi:serine/threonine-protein phosphatase PPG1